MTDRPTRPLNIDLAVVVNVRPLPGGQVEVLLEVSGEDYQRLLDEPQSMTYYLPEHPQASVREQFYVALDQATERRPSAHYLAKEDGTLRTLVNPHPDGVREHVQQWFNREGRDRAAGIHIPALHSSLEEQ